MITKTMIKTNRDLIKRLNELGVTPFYVDSEKDDFGTEIVFWDFKIKKGQMLFIKKVTSWSLMFVPIFLKNKWLCNTYKIDYPNHIVEYDDFYYVSLVVYVKDMEI